MAMLPKPQKEGKIAFITTPKFRESNPELTNSFICRHLYTLCNAFEVMTTGRTLELINRIVDTVPQGDYLKLVEQDMKLQRATAGDLDRWRTTISDQATRCWPWSPTTI